MSWLFQSIPKGMRYEFMGIWGLRLRSSPAIFTDQGQINRVVPFSEWVQGLVGSSLPVKKLNDNNWTNRGWWGRWWSLGNLEITIIKARHCNQCGGWTNKQKLTTHTPCREIEYQQNKIRKYLRKDSVFVLFLWLVGEVVLISDSSGFKFGPNKQISTTHTLFGKISEKCR